MVTTSVLSYLLKSTIAFTALYGLYLVLFKRNQQFLISRFYLIFTVVFASLFPFIKFISYKTIEIPAIEKIIPEVANAGSILTTNKLAISFWNYNNMSNIAFYLYLIVSSLIFVRLLYMLIRFCVNLFKHSKVERLYGRNVIISEYWDQTFSFFGIIVLPKNDLQLKENQLLVMHELAHVKQCHSVDLLLAELFQIIHWFNPLAHLIRKDMREIHEFLADYSVVSDGVSKHAYQQLLLNYLANSITPRVANSFSAKLLKKRFAMMTTNKTPKSVLIKYTLAIPVIAMLIGLMSFQTEIMYVEKQTPIEFTEKSENTVNGDKVNPQPAESETIANALQEKDPYEAMTTRLKEYAKNYTMLKLFQIDNKNTQNELPVILKEGCVYRFYLVGEEKDKAMKQFVAITKETKEGTSELKSLDISCHNGYSSTKFTCTETGAYKLRVVDNSAGEKYIVGLYFQEMVEIDKDKKETTPIIKYETDKTSSQKDTSKYATKAFIVVEEMPKFNNRGLEAAREHIAQNLKYPKAAKDKGIQGNVFVNFVVESNGKVSNVKVVKSVDPMLDAEATKVIEEMPDWTPGKQRGKNVDVQFTLPVVFSLSEKPQNFETEQVVLSSTKEEKYEPFVVVEQMPKFNNQDVEAAREYMAKNVKYPETAAKQGIQGKVFISFVVEEDGSVSTAKIERGVDPLLDKEAIRAAESMPKWTPGYQRGKAVRVKLTVPVAFTLDNKK